MRVVLTERIQESADTMTFRFDLAGQTYEFQPGQYAFYELDALSAPDPRGKRRHFTISNSPTETGFLQFTTKLRGSGFKETLRAAPLGLEVTLEPSRGNFILPEDDGRLNVFLTGGIGITPLRAFTRFIADKKLPTRALLLYSNRAPDDIVFRAELDALARANPNLRVVYTLTDAASAPNDWTGEVGRLNEAMVRKHVADFSNSRFWITGPPPLVKAMAEVLKAMGVADAAVKVERFTGY